MALEEGHADLAVHSLKDVPMDLPEGFALACVMEREDPRDAFVSNRYAALADLPQGAVVGTSSLRRMVLLRSLRPDLKIEPLRGNLDTRLRKLDEGNYDAIVLAAAGLKRLGLGQRIRAGVRARADAAGRGAGRTGHRGARRPRRPAGDCWRRWRTSPPGWPSRPSVRSAAPWAAAARCRWRRSRTFSGEYLQLRAAWGDPDGATAAGAGAVAPARRPTWSRPPNSATQVAGAAARRRRRTELAVAPCASS